MVQKSGERTTNECTLHCIVLKWRRFAFYLQFSMLCLYLADLSFSEEISVGSLFFYFYFMLFFWQAIEESLYELMFGIILLLLFLFSCFLFSSLWPCSRSRSRLRLRSRSSSSSLRKISGWNNGNSCYIWRDRNSCWNNRNSGWIKETSCCFNT